MTHRDEDKHWHLDRKVPLALIFAIFVQTATAFWWASDQNTRLTTVEKRVEAMGTQPERITRVEVKVEGVQADVSEIKSDVKRLLSK